jgi:pimeloyl-ACP methyl ester carboxylesterase
MYGVTVARSIEVELAHLRMHALSWGPEDGRLALCVHGFPDSAHSWRFVGPMLAAKGFRVVAPFTRGYDPTGPATDGDYHLGALMYDLITVNDHLGGAHDAVLIGHDWGSLTACALAAYPGSPFAAYVAMAVPPLRALDTSGYSVVRNVRLRAIQLRMSWYILFFQLPFLPERVLHRVIPRLWRDWSPPGTDVRADVATALAALSTIAHRKAAVAYYRALLRFTRPARPYAGLHRFRFKPPVSPMLVLHGEQDGAVQAGWVDQMIDALPPGSRVEKIARAGHFLQLDQPDAVCAAILKYLKVK